VNKLRVVAVVSTGGPLLSQDNLVPVRLQTILTLFSHTYVSSTLARPRGGGNTQRLHAEVNDGGEIVLGASASDDDEASDDDVGDAETQGEKKKQAREKAPKLLTLNPKP